jgi:DegV family protein with EDD domain
MSTVALVTDTTSNLPPDLAARLGVRVVPVYVNFGTESLKDYEELPPAKFYEKLAAVKAAGGEMPKTSQPNPEDFRKVYDACKAAGATDVISIHVSAKASGTCGSAELAKAMVPGLNVHVVDSASTSMVIGYMLLDAHAALAAGKSAAEALAAIEAIKLHSLLAFTVTEIEHLTASGRTEGAERSAAAAVGVKPIVAVLDGVPKAVGQARTQKAALEQVLALVKEKAGGAPMKRLSIVNGNVDATAREWMKEAAAALGYAGEVTVVDFGPALAVHFGPGLLGVAAQWG